MEKKEKLELAKLGRQSTISDLVNSSENGIVKIKEQFFEIKSELEKTRNDVHVNSYKGYDVIKHDIERLKLLEDNRKKAERQIQIYYTLKLYKENRIKTIEDLIKEKEFNYIISYNRLYSLMIETEKSIELMSVIDNDLSESIYDFIEKFKQNESVAKGFMQELISNYGHLSLIDFNIFFKMCLRRDLGDMYGLSVSELVRLLAIYEGRKQEAIEKQNETK